MPARARSSQQNLDRARLAGQGARVVRAEALAWLAGPAAAEAAPFDVVIADPPYEDAVGLLAKPGAASNRSSHRGRAWSPSTSGGTRRRPSVGLLASERERRFGETALTFYRRQEDR